MIRSAYLAPTLGFTYVWYSNHIKLWEKDYFDLYRTGLSAQ